MANNEKFTPGETVWVIERDEDGTAVEVVGYVFLALVAGAVIATSKIENYSLCGIMDYHIGQTAIDEETSLCVFPENDCYTIKADARAAYAEEVEG